MVYSTQNYCGCELYPSSGYTISYKTYSMAIVRERTIRLSNRHLLEKLVPTFADRRVSRGQRNGSLRPYSRLSGPEPLLFLPSSSSIVLTSSGSRARKHNVSETGSDSVFGWGERYTMLRFLERVILNHGKKTVRDPITETSCFLVIQNSGRWTKYTTPAILRQIYVVSM
jgi:hypothetical protein